MVKKNGTKKVLSVILTFVLTTFIVIGAVFPAGAITLSPETLKALFGFVQDYNNGELDEEKVEEFIKDHIYKLEGATDVTTGSDSESVTIPGGEGEDTPTSSAIERLENLLSKNENGDPDYRELLDYFKTDEDEPIENTVSTIIDVVGKLDDVEQVVEFVQLKKQEEEAKAEAEKNGYEYFPVKYTVEWYLDGSDIPSFVQADKYNVSDVFVLPDTFLPSGYYIDWDIPPFFIGTVDDEGNPTVTKIYGTTVSLAQTIVDITNGIEQVGNVYEATISADGKTVVISLDASSASYVDLFSDFFANNTVSSLKNDLLNIIVDTLSAGLEAGVHDFSVNGEKLLTVESYEFADLFDLLTSRDITSLVNVEGFINLLRAEDKTLARFIDMKAYDDGDPNTDLWEIGQYTVKMSTAGCDDTEVNVVLTLSGDVSNIETVASVLSDIVDIERVNGTLSMSIDLSSANMQVLLKRAYNNSNVPESIRKHIVKIAMTDAFGAPEDVYIISGDMTIGELKKLIKNADYGAVGDKIDGKIDTGHIDFSDIAESEKFQKLLDKVLSYIPEEYENTSYHDLYDGDGMFCFDKTIEKQWLEEKIDRYLSNRQITLAGHSVSLKNVANRVLSYIDVTDVDFSLDIKIGDYHQIILHDANKRANEFFFFVTPDVPLSELANIAKINKLGHHILYTIGTNAATVTPCEDAVVLYDIVSNKHKVTYNIKLTDNGEQYKTLTFDVDYKYGSTIDATGDITAKTGGHTYVSGTLAGVPQNGLMPDEDITVTATYAINYYTIKWVVGDRVVETDSDVRHGDIPTYDGAIPTKKSEDPLKKFVFKSWDKSITAASADTVYTAVFEEKNRFSDPIDSTINEDYRYDSSAHIVYLEVTPKGSSVDGAYHALDDILTLFDDFEEVPSLVSILKNQEGREIARIELSSRDLAAILAALGDDVTDATYELKVGVIQEGINAGRRYVSVTICNGNGDPISVSGLSGAGVSGINATIRMMYIGDGSPETNPKVYYYDTVNDKNVDVEYSVVDNYVYIKTTHFSTFVIAEEPIKYDITIDSDIQNGSLSADVSSAAMGDTVNLTVTPDTHYRIKSVYYLDKDDVRHVITYSNGYHFTMPSGEITVCAEFEKIPYTVTFLNPDGTQFVVIIVNSGESIPAHRIPEGPSKASTDQYVYTFSHWDPDIAGVAIGANIEVRPFYNQALRKYTVIFVDWNDVEISREQVAYGFAATAPVDPTRSDDDEYTYTFAGWSGRFDNVTEDITVKAIYNAVLKSEGTVEPEEVTSSPMEEDTTDIPAVDVSKTNVGKIILIVLLIIIILLLLLVVVGYLLYLRGIVPAFILWLLLDKLFGRDVENIEPEAVPEEPIEEAEPVPAENLFIPLGEEIPEEEPEEIVHVQEVSVESVDEMMTDKTAERILVISDKVGGIGKLGIINVGTLSSSFEENATVTLDVLKEKGMIEGSIGRLKVLASGKIDKPMTVEADAFSVQAIKMITLTGGQAIKLKNLEDGIVEKTILEHSEAKDVKNTQSGRFTEDVVAEDVTDHNTVTGEDEGKDAR